MTARLRDAARDDVYELALRCDEPSLVKTNSPVWHVTLTKTALITVIERALAEAEEQAWPSEESLKVAIAAEYVQVAASRCLESTADLTLHERCEIAARVALRGRK